MMSENGSSKREDRLMLLTGGLVSSGAIGWLLYKDFKSQQLDCKAIMTIAGSLTAGIVIYFTGATLICKWRKSNESHMKSIISEGDASDLTALEISLVERFASVVKELDKLAIEAKKAKEGKCLDKKTFMNNIQEADEVPCKPEDTTKKLINSKRKAPKNGLTLPIDNQMEVFCNEVTEIRKARFRAEILSYISELKGCVQGTLDSLPSTRNIQFCSTDDEICRQVVTIVKEYTNSMLTKLEQVIDEFVDSVCKSGQVNDKGHKVKEALKTLEVSEKDLSLTPLKIELEQYYDALENVTKSKSQTPFYQNSQRSKIPLGDNKQPFKSISNFFLHEECPYAENSRRLLSLKTKLAAPPFADFPLMSKEENGPDQCAIGKRKNSNSNPFVKLNQDQINCLNILKSELNS